jgi:hypothetical protein
MSKTKKNFRVEEKGYWDEDTDYHKIENNQQKRKNKRLVNILRSRNIQGLLDMEDEDEE